MHRVSKFPKNTLDKRGRKNVQRLPPKVRRPRQGGLAPNVSPAGRTGGG
jgi:hypothetical protein